MKHIIWILCLLFVVALPYGCESYQDSEKSPQQREEEREAGKHLDQTTLPERGNNIRR